MNARVAPEREEPRAVRRRRARVLEVLGEGLQGGADVGLEA